MTEIDNDDAMMIMLNTYRYENTLQYISIPNGYYSAFSLHSDRHFCIITEQQFLGIVTLNHIIRTALNMYILGKAQIVQVLLGFSIFLLFFSEQYLNKLAIFMMVK